METKTAINSIEEKFYKYIFTSMITMFLQGLYSIVDGLFISNLVGDVGLSAVNVAWPILAVIVAIGTGTGCGGSVIMSMKQGEGSNEESNKVRANIMMTLAAVSIVVTVAFYLGLPTMLKMMGTENQLFDYAMMYGRVMILGSTLQIFAAGLTPILRNDNKAVTAMVIMVSGLFCNLILDYFFIYKLNLGIRGAAAASLCAQGVTVISCLVSIFTNKERKFKLNQFKFDISVVGRIFKIGISPFGISLAPSLLIMINNIQCISYGGDMAIAVFSLITSTIGSYRILLIGVAEGIQPLVSYAKGAGDYAAMKRIRNKGIITAVTVSVILFVFTVLTADNYAGMFGLSEENASNAYWPIIISSTQLIFTGLVRVSNSFFYAVGKDKYSLFMIYFDPLIMTPLLVWILPKFFGLNGIWISTTVSQIILNIAAVYMYIKHNKEITKLAGGEIA